MNQSKILAELAIDVKLGLPPDNVHCVACGRKTNMKITIKSRHFKLNGTPVYRLRAHYRCPRFLHSLIRTLVYQCTIEGKEQDEWTRVND